MTREDIPLEYYCQVQHQLMVTGKERCYLAVLIGGNEMRRYTVERDEEFIENMRAVLVDFWERYVEGDEIPPTTTTEDVLALYPHDSGRTIKADITAQSHYDNLISIRKHIDELEACRKEVEHALQDHMQDASVLEGFAGELATWRTHERRKFDLKALRKDEPETAEKYTSVVETRTFRLKRGGDDE